MDNMLPSSGEEYLRMVKAQARKCPAVVVASGAQKHLAAKNTSRKYRTDWQSCHPAPEGCAPTSEWKDQFMVDFNNTRASLKQYKQSQERQAKRASVKQDKEQEATEDDDQHIIPSLSNSRPQSSSPLKHAPVGAARVVMPKMYDEQKWRTLLYGSTASTGPSVVQVASTMTAATSSSSLPLAETNAQDSARESDATPILSATETQARTQTTTPIATTTTAIRQGGMLPSPQFLIRLDQGHLIQLLRYHLRWLAEDDLNEHEGKWLYALFLKLDVLVESDQVAVLRNIAKKCARIRTHFHSDSGSKLATVNMVITIVARLFGQGDLE
ncbi:gem (nuclear organelle) associated protein 2 [Mortierella sp. NVP41]|nr:gem (nuclear organelle) associated protein 2 [Mortierella sp. NVP41]